MYTKKYNYLSFAKRSKLILAPAIMMLFSSNVFATWSIIAVDRMTGEIGIAGASCTFDVQGIASIVPGKGAIVVQAASSYFARIKGVELMTENKSPEQVMEAMQDEKFDPEQQQYGVIALASDTMPIVYSGKLIHDWNGSKIGSDFAVLGNILVGKEVIEKASISFDKNRHQPLANRLMLALSAGEQAGGDKRCGSQYARSAFLSVYDPEEGAIIKLSTHGITLGGQQAVKLLNKQFDDWSHKKK